MFTQVKFRVNLPAGNIFEIPYKNLTLIRAAGGVYDFQYFEDA
jgi:hypothetical protein